MKYAVDISAQKQKKSPLRLLIIWALLASAFFSFFSVTQVNAATFPTDSTINQVKAVKYWAMLTYCAENFKTSITGSDIDNGPRWWISSGDGVSLGVIFDKWGGKDGKSTCAGEGDSEPGWISDVFKTFDIAVPSDRTARDNFLETKLGYSCKKSGDSTTCTNDSAQKDASYNNSVLGQIKKNSPYLNGSAPTVGLNKNAYNYILAINAIAAANGCKASEGGNTNLISVAYVDNKGVEKKSDWAVKNDGGSGRMVWSGVDVDVGESSRTVVAKGGGITTSQERSCKDLAKITVDNADDYKKLLAAATCRASFPNGNAMFQEGCALGAANKTDYSICYSVSDTTIGNNYRQPAAQYRIGCFSGQGVPLVADGRSAGQVCYDDRGYRSSILAACIKGAINHANPDYCNKEYAYYSSTGDYTDYNKDAREACQKGANLPGLTDVVLTPPSDFTTLVPTGAGGVGDPKTSCVVDGIGWMICPLMNALGGLNDALYGWVESVLVLNPLTQTDSVSGDQTPQYQNWSRIRDIANVLLVIGFLAIIFSQITSIGISNYGVKRMLPRIVLIAIAINLSWVIMSLAIDVVNVLGVGLNALLDSAAVNASADTLNFSRTVSDLVSGAGIAAIAVGGGVLAAFLTASGGSTLVLLAAPFILGAVLALLAAVATLFLRNALIIVLVIISPVAIVAYLLPNTEEYFKRWRKLFMSMLLLFPMAALLFSGAKFAAYVIVTSNQPLAQISALFVMAAPLGMLPWLANSAGGILSTVNGRLGNMAKSIQGATQRGLQNRVETGRAERRAGLRNALGGRRDPNFKGRGTGETYGKDGAHYERGSDGKLKQVMHKAGDTKVDKEGVPLGKTRRTRRTGSQYFAERGEELKERTSTAQSTLKSNFQDRGLSDQGKPGSQTLAQKRNQRVAGVVDASKVAGLRAEGIEAQYKGRLEVAKLVDGEAKTLYDRLQDAGATTHALEEEQTLRQKDRLKSNVENTAAASIGLSRLEQVSASSDLNISDASATRLNNLAVASLEGGGNLGLKVLHENQEAAEQGVKTIDAQFEAELADRKKFGGNLFESAAAEAAYKAQAASAGKDFDAAIKELATKDTTDRKLRDRILGPKPDPSDIKANQDWETRAAQFDAAASTGGGEPSIRERLQEAATEDYINNSRIEQAEMDKKLGIDAEMQKDNELVRRAAGVGTEKRVRASAAKRLEADRQGDVSATEELLERGATSRDESLALLGMDIYGKPLFDEKGNFVYQGNTPEETQTTWDNYVNGRKKIGQPLSGTDESNKTPRAVPNEERQLDGVEQEALLRRTIKQGDKKANVRPTLDFIRDNVKDAKAKREAVYADASSTQEQKDEADDGVKSAVRLQAAAIQQYASTPGALSPFLSSGDQGAMVDGTFERETDDLVINTFGSEKLGDPGFAAKWNIDHFKDAAGVFEDLARSPDQLTADEKTAVDARLAQSGVQPVAEPADTAPQADKDAYDEYKKKFYKARIEKHFDDILVADGFTVPEKPADTAPQADKDAYKKALERRDAERIKRIQSFADARKGIDQVDDNEAFKPDGRAHEQIYKIRNVMDILQEAEAIPPPSADRGEQYRRKSYTDEPGVAETTPSGQQVYLEQEKDKNDPKGFVQKKYYIDENGLKVPYVSSAPVPGQQPANPTSGGGAPPAPLPPDNFVG